jgi:hypothetical protein
MPTAILIDGDFFLKRHRFIYGTMKPAEIAQGMHKMCLDHLNWKDERRFLRKDDHHEKVPGMVTHARACAGGRFLRGRGRGT